MQSSTRATLALAFVIAMSGCGLNQAPEDGGPGRDAEVEDTGTPDGCVSESCNGEDDDCDARVDEGLQTDFFVDADGDGYGAASDSMRACSRPEGYVTMTGDCDDDDATVNPGATEACDGVDTDCDGVLDPPSCACMDGASRSCGTDVGICESGMQSCEDGVWGECTDAVEPTDEVCNDLDDDCSGVVDEGCPESVSWSAQEDLPTYGGTGGSVFREICPDGEALIEFRLKAGIKVDGFDYARTVSELRASCATVEVTPDTSSVPYEYSLTGRPGTNLATLGSSTESAYTFRCPDGEWIAGMNLEYGNMGVVNNIQLICRQYEVRTTEGGFELIRLDTGTVSDRLFPDAPVDDVTTMCPGNKTAVGLNGQAGNDIDAIGLVCREPDLLLR